MTHTNIHVLRSGEKLTITYEESGLELFSNEGVTTFRDDFPFTGPLANRLSPASKNLVENLLPRRAVVTDGVTFFLYCESVASWSQLYSEVAGYELLSITGINAPVNYSRALKWAYALAKRIAFPVARLHPSVCIGTYRLVFKCEYEEMGPIVHFRPHWPVIPRGDMDSMYERILTFVKSPIVFPNPVVCPYTVKVDIADTVISKILLPLRYDQKLDLLWRVGNAITDPVKNPCVIVLYGKNGHEGKSEIAKNITKMLPDAVTWVSEDLFGSGGKWPDVDTIMQLCQSRILVCDECKIKDGFSYDHVKRWTSESPVSSDGRTGYLSQTAFVISNHIPFYERAAVNNSIGRRLVVYHMKKKLTKFKPLSDDEISNAARLRFVALALSVSSAYKHPPVSLAIALYSIFRKNVNRFTAGLVHDVAASPPECHVATMVMAIRCGVSVRSLCSVFSAMTPGLVGEPEIGLPYIKSIRDTRRILTTHGHEFVNKLTSANVPSYDLEAMLERAALVGH